MRENLGDNLTNGNPMSRGRLPENNPNLNGNLSEQNVGERNLELVLPPEFNDIQIDELSNENESTGSVANLETPEINVLQSPEYTEILKRYLPVFLSPELKDKIVPQHGAVLSIDAQGFSQTTTALVEQALAKRIPVESAGEEIALKLNIADQVLAEIAAQYGGYIFDYQGDGKTLFFPQLSGESSPSQAAQRAVLVAHHFLYAQDVQQLSIDIGGENRPIRFRAGVDVTGEHNGGLSFASLGNQYSRNFAAFGGIISRAEKLQKEADPTEQQVIVSPQVVQIMPESTFVTNENNHGILVEMNFGGVAQPTEEILPISPIIASVNPEEINRYYESHIPMDRREELRLMAEMELSNRPVENPEWEYNSVATVFIQIERLDALREEELNSVVNELQQIAHNNRGGVERVTGEGVLYLVFEGPSNSYHAARAAVEISKFLRSQKLSSRSGVATGKAFAGTAGSENNRTFTYIGASINLSARLMQNQNLSNEAITNPVVISEELFHLAGHRLRCRQESPISLRGVGTVNCYQVEGVDYRASRYVQTENVVGREREQSYIEQRINRVGETGIARMIVIEGEAGIGKSALINKTISDNLEKGIISHVDIRCDEAQRKMPLAAMRQFVRQVLNIPDGVDNGELITYILNSGLQPEIIEQLSLLDAVLDTNFEDNETTNKFKWLDKAEQKTARIKLISQLLANHRSIHQNVVQVIYMDDWQFVDSQSAKMLSEIITANNDQGILWLVPTRPGENDIEKGIIKNLKEVLPQEVTGTVRVKLFPHVEQGANRERQLEWFNKNQEAVWNIMCAVFPIDPNEINRNPIAAARIAARIFSQNVSHGNVFYVREILTHLAMNGKELGAEVFVRNPETGLWHFGDYQLPGETQDMVKAKRKYYLEDELLESIPNLVGAIEMMKFNALSLKSQKVAKAMAILGLETTGEMLLRLTGLTERELGNCLNEMIDGGLIIDLDNNNFGFAHRITQEKIYESIAGKKEKPRTHARILGILEDQSPDNAVKTSLKFFHAKNSGNNPAIAKYADVYGGQLRRSGEDTGAISVLERGIQAFNAMEQSEFEGMTEEQIIEQVNMQMERMFTIQSIWFDLAKYKDSLQTLGQIQEIFHKYYPESDTEEFRLANALWMARALSEQAMVLLRLGGEHRPVAKDLLEKALKALEPFEPLIMSKPSGMSQEVYNQLLINLSNTNRRSSIYYRYKKNRQLALDYARNSYAYAERVTHNTYDVMTASLNGLGIAYNQIGQPENALDYYEKYANLAEQENNLPDQILAMNNMAAAYKRMRDIDRAIDVLKNALQLSERIYRPSAQASVNKNLGELYLDTNNYESAIRFLSRALDLYILTGRIGDADGMRLDLAQGYIVGFGNSVRARELISDVAVDADDDFRMDVIDNLHSACDVLETGNFSQFIEMCHHLDNPTEGLTERMNFWKFNGEFSIQYNIPFAVECLEKALSLATELNDGLSMMVIEEELANLRVSTH